MISISYNKKYNIDAISGLIIIRRDIIRVNRMEYLCVYKKHEDIKDNDLQCVKKWVRINIEGSDADVFKDRE